MNEQHPVLEMRERTMANPLEQRIGVGRVEDLADRVAGTLGPDAGRDCQQMEIVVAEHDGRARTKFDERAKRGQGRGAAVDDVAGDPERCVGGGRKLVEQEIEG